MMHDVCSIALCACFLCVGLCIPANNGHVWIPLLPGTTHFLLEGVKGVQVGHLVARILHPHPSQVLPLVHMAFMIIFFYIKHAEVTPTRCN